MCPWGAAQVAECVGRVVQRGGMVQLNVPRRVPGGEGGAVCGVQTHKGSRVAALVVHSWVRDPWR